MSNRRKNKLIDTYVDYQSGANVEIFLTPDNTFGTNEMFGVSLTAKTYDELVTKVSAFLKENITLNFQPVIKFATPDRHFSSQSNQAAAVSLLIERFLWAARPDGSLVSLAWDYKDAPLKQKLSQVNTLHIFLTRASKFEPPVKTSNSIIYLPYTDELWQGLQKMLAAILAASQQVDSLLSEPHKAAQRIMQMGSKLQILPGGSDEKK